MSQRTPSSPASSLSSAGPSTPPMATFYHSHVVPLPPMTPALASSDLDRPSSVSSFRAPAQAGTPVPVSAVLATATNGGKPRIKWDMACDPLRWAYDRELKDTGLSLVLSEPAASPDVARLLVTISGASYPYEIFVERPTSLTAPLYVSIRDVLVAIFDNLWRPVTAAEQQGAAQQNPRAWQAACAAHRQRAAGRSGEDMRRLDFLTGRTVFQGLGSKGVNGKIPQLEVRVGARES
ncbi:uncharacterized protein C8Q71DRAFT_708585 [Rhodofomes roseus]|uniref:DUF6699 domain-containing protein n=1 Tax=Rhodofomes roseus TaxID=34475 RepID=A0ABQ8KFG7_9APHY|nr:uncharacterized protein C8Q71DRAFT_708585 [Rhodofomes roseus]KAH9836130.1 hypothetical protein C8Q71DRAFT_708585 [Rhodofomes roseus]